MRPAELVRRVARNGGRVLRRLLAHASVPPEGFWLDLRLEAPIDEVERPHLSATPSPGLLEILETLEVAAADRSVAGLLVRIDGGAEGLAGTASLRRAIAAVRERGVPVVVYGELLDTETLWLASVATHVCVPETGRVFLIGLRAESYHLKGLLDRLDVEPEVVRIGSHKSAGEMYTHERMSPEHREQLEALVDDWFEMIVADIAIGRGLTADEVRSRVDRGPYTAASALEAGLVDACVYPDALDDTLKSLAPLPRDGGARATRRIDARDYYAMRVDAAFEPVFSEAPRLAYVVASGAITRGRHGRGVPSEALAAHLDRVRADRGVLGVVLRIDSPGGDALASDLLWRSLTRLGEEKPVVASMGEVAASGGYYMACAADAIFAEAGTVTGSIGVLGGKLNLEGLYRKLGIGRDGAERGARAGLYSEARAFTGEERHAVRDEMQSLYEVFVERVATGRALSTTAVERVAGGRVWSGVRARSNGLVDAIGGPLQAIAEARRRGGLLPGERVRIDVFPRRPRLPGLRALLRWIR
jgi:protease-4